MTVRVLTALDHHLETRVVTTLGQAREATVVRRCADLADLLAAAAAGLADVAVVSAGLRLLDRDALERLARAEVGVVGIVSADADGEDAERRLRQLGVGFVLPVDADPDSLAATLADASGAGPAEAAAGDGAAGEDPGEGVRRGRVLAVWGPPGSPGRTTVALALADRLARSGEVLLVDADTWAASVAQTLAIVDEAPGVVAAARAADQGTLDRPALARLAPRAPGGFRVLTGLPRADRWPEVRPLALAEVLRVGRTLADTVVVDLASPIEDDEELSYDTVAPRRNGATLAALEAADEVVVVGAGDPVGLQRLVRAVQDLAGRPSGQTRVVVNKVRETAVGARPERTIRAALERFSGLTDLTFVPWDPAACDAALLAGHAVTAGTRRSAVAAALEPFAASLAAYDRAPASSRAR